MVEFVPLGDQAALASFPDERSAVAFALAARRANPSWLVDVVQSYASVAVYFDLQRIRFRTVAEQLRQLEVRPTADSAGQGRLHHVPCCYEFGLDLCRVAHGTGLAAEEVIRQHAATDYTVYAIGFCPGFPYLGYLPPGLCGMPRLDQPRLRVEAGSVGLTGRQTGIYPLPRPGGWNLIGRTPLELVHIADGYFPLRTGDQVRFVRIDEAEFRRLAGQRL